MKTGIENENGFQNETQTSFQNENEPVIWIENETELQNEIEMKNRFQNETGNENEGGNENENELQNGFQNGFQNETEVQNELKKNSQNELENQSQNELKALQDYNERFNRENCIELLWEHFRELHKLKPIITKAGLKADIKKYSDGFKTIQYYETDYNKFRVERVWQTEPTKKMIDLRIIKIEGE